MKLLPLCCLAVPLILAGCNMNSHSPLAGHAMPDSPVALAAGTVNLTTRILEVEKNPDSRWQTLLPGWKPKKVVTTVNTQTLKNTLSTAKHIDINATTLSSTPDGTPVPLVIVTESAGETGGYHFVFTPSVNHADTSITLGVNMDIQDPKGSVNMDQVVSIPHGQSLLVARALSEDKLQIVIVTPQAGTGL